MRDERIFPEPDQFIPTRYLNADRGSVNNDLPYDPSKFVFGFGRRICPGKELADASIFLTVAMCLATLNIGKAIDEGGNEIEPVVNPTPGLFSCPQKFHCEIRPRSVKAEQLIYTIEDEHPWEEGDAGKLEGLE